MQIIKLHGTEEKLYQLVAPLVMNPSVLKFNNNYPFKTGENFIWFVALNDEAQVIGFFPVEARKTKLTINNYYVAEDIKKTMTSLLKAVQTEAKEKKRKPCQRCICRSTDTPSGNLRQTRVRGGN